MPAVLSPYISVENVQAALDRLLHSSQPPSPNPLERLLLVDHLLIDPAAPRSPLARELVLNDVLVSSIQEHLTALRLAHNLFPPEMEAALPVAREQLAEDGRTSSPDLIGWSILFYRYVTIGLGLSVEQLAEALSVDARTVRRYQSRAVRRLTHWLIQAEWNARRRQHQMRLRASLPSQTRPMLIGRASIRTVFERLRREQSPRHVVVSGAHGIGKTAVVQDYAHELIDQDAIDQIIWIDRPADIEQIIRSIADQVVPAEGQGALEEYLQLLRVLVILDDVDALVVSAETEVPGLLARLSAADVMFIGCEDRLMGDLAHVRVPDLSEEDAIRLTERLLAGSDEPPDEIRAFGSSIWHAVGGNPLLIRLAAASNQFVETLMATNVDVLDRIYGQVLSGLNRAEKRAWLMITLCPPDEISLTQLSALWPSEMPSAAIESLIARSLLDLVSRERGTFLMVAAARRFLQGRAAIDADLQAQITDLLTQLDWQPETSPLLRNTLLYCMQQSWLTLSSSQRLRILHRLAPVYIPTTQRAQWRAILEAEYRRRGALDADLQTAYAVCLRQSSAFEVASTVLAELIRQTGLQGQFVEQARAMLELSVIYRYQGDYERGASLLTKAEKTGRRFHESALMDRTRVELAQIEVDRGEGSAALRLLENLPRSVRVLALIGEALLLDEDAAHSGEVLDEALAQPDLDSSTLARLQSLRGRALEAQGLLDVAHDALALAVTLLEQGDDLFALARARSNLAAVLITLGRRPGVAELLRRAEAAQRILGDRIGLMATRHNLHLLHIRSSR